jgi:hypothetical protein
LPENDLPFQINPFPIALKENVIRIYDFKKIEVDSLINLGLTFKLDFCNDTGIFVNYYSDSEKHSTIGLVINNKLISVTNIYIKEELNYTKRQFQRFLVFTFPKQTQVKVESYKRAFFNQTLIRNEK